MNYMYKVADFLHAIQIHNNGLCNNQRKISLVWLHYALQSVFLIYCKDKCLYPQQQYFYFKSMHLIFIRYTALIRISGYLTFIVAIQLYFCLFLCQKINYMLTYSAISLSNIVVSSACIHERFPWRNMESTFPCNNFISGFETLTLKMNFYFWNLKSIMQFRPLHEKTSL